MADGSYHYRKPIHRKKRGWGAAIITFVLLILVFGGLVVYDVYRGRSQQQAGPEILSEFEIKREPTIKITEPTFTLELPADWKEMRRTNSTNLYGITWQATKAKEDNRFLTLYIDRIPRKLAVNRMLPLEAVGNELRHGAVSDNCAEFTPGGELNAQAAVKARETPAQWEEVNFICDLPKVFDNVVGTGSAEGVNVVTVNGSKAGSHKYFFVYTDHNIRPNYEILLEIVKSFKAR